jgi:hypothetical protein
MAMENKFYGVYRGVVVDNKDPLNKGRLKLRIPQVLGDTVTEWAWGVQQPAVFQNIPKVSTGVFVMFEGGDASFPIWTGAFDRVDTPNNWGSFYDTTNHTIASTTTAYRLTLNSSEGGSGVSVVDGSKITVDSYGVYNLQFSAQLASTDTSLHNANLWIRLNGIDVPASTGQLTVPNSHGGVNGQMVTSWNYLLEMNAGDYVEFWWQAENTNIYIETIPTGTTPTTPVNPSIAVTIFQVK